MLKGLALPLSLCSRGAEHTTGRRTHQLVPQQRLAVQPARRSAPHTGRAGRAAQSRVPGFRRLHRQGACRKRPTTRTVAPEQDGVHIEITDLPT